MCIKIIIGLGNFQEKFNKTRHNVGSWLVKEFLKQEKINTIKRGKIYKIFLKNKKIYFYIPNTYMNNSGKHIYIIKKKLKLNNNNILIIQDEIDLLPGRVKIKKGIGSMCGHNGIKDIINNIKGKINFYRLRIGIGKPLYKNIKKFVLSKPTKNEKKKIMKSIKKSIFCIKLWIKKNNLPKIMNILHSKKSIS